MTSRFVPGQAVQTPLGPGVIVEVRNARQLLVQVKARTVLFTIDDIREAPASEARPRRGPLESDGRGTTPSVPAPAKSGAARSIDLHGLTVDAALEALTAFINEALLADVGEMRVVHGRSGGKLRAAVHRRLRELPFVRAYRVDPRNPGVTIVVL